MGAPATRKPYTPRMALADRREQLLDAAIAIIARDGYRGVSIEAVAREADVARTVVYRAFDSLGELLFALLDRQERRAIGQLLAELPDLGQTPLDAYVVEVVRRWIAAVNADPLTWRPILASSESVPAAVRDRIERQREVLRARIAALLGAGLAVHGGPELDAQVSAHALLAVAEHFGRLLVEQPERFQAQRLVRAVELILGVLRPGPLRDR